MQKRMTQIMIKKKVYLEQGTYGEIVQLELDYSNADIFTQEGAKITYQDAKEMDASQANVNRPLLRGASKGSGAQTVFSGGTIYKGVLVKQSAYGYNFSYKADYTIFYGKIEWGTRYADRLDRIYGISYRTSRGGSIISSGVFRKNEKPGYSSYGGVKMVVNDSGGGNFTIYNYIRVAKDKVWLDYKLN
ncbi:hypothetical protein [Listeria fleischmannii]|uniref:hypothetical protein n=1 Tax=Listeria fleischmannii TaxID=1069827 RepID=UPI001F4CFD93|nr:hypothetical protein [Listeria fleischmannii]